MQAEALYLEAAGAPLVRRPLPLAPPQDHEAVVEVLACGLCHTDLGFFDGSVAPRHPLPLVLGHEVVGKVVQAGPRFAHLVGAEVIVPAVLPCGDCPFCRAGRANACPAQKMPGNDIHGGFATALAVPAAPLVPLRGLAAHVDRRALAVVADAVSTAYQAVRRSGLASGDAALVVGAGGVGGFVIQIARALGARVVACDTRNERLSLAAQHGAQATVNVLDRTPQEVKKEVHAVARGWAIPSLGHRIFECSGTTSGQTLAFALLGRAATLVQVGFTPEPVPLRFSNLMAFDATVHGTWGCPPELYPEVLGLIEERQVVLEPFVDYAPMSRAGALLEEMAQGRLPRRMVLDPRA